MSNKQLERPWNLGREVVIVTGSFDVNNTSNPASPVTNGGVTVARAGVAQYTVTIPTTFARTYYLCADYRAGAAVNVFAQVSGVAVSGSNTVVTVNLVTGSGVQAADQTAGTGKNVDFFFVFGNTGVNP